MQRSLLLVLSSLFLVIAPLTAQPKPLGRERSDTVTRWQETLQKADAALVAKDWQGAKKVTDSLLEEMFERIEGGEGAAPMLARATALRALAEAGLGNDDLATWDFGAALTLFPELSTVDLSRYHEAGHVLDQWWSKESEESAASSPALSGDIPASGEPTLTPPQRLEDSPPRYPFAKRRACGDGTVQVEMSLDQEGIPRSPKLLGEPDSMLAYATLNALRSWRFKPATLNGKPIATHYNLTVNFEHPSCKNPVARAAKARKRVQ